MTAFSATAPTPKPDSMNCMKTFHRAMPFTDRPVFKPLFHLHNLISLYPRFPSHGRQRRVCGLRIQVSRALGPLEALRKPDDLFTVLQSPRSSRKYAVDAFVLNKVWDVSASSEQQSKILSKKVYGSDNSICQDRVNNQKAESSRNRPKDSILTGRVADS